MLTPHLFALSSIALAFFSSPICADTTALHTQTIYYLPPTSSTFQPLAKLSFNVSRPELSKVNSFTPPASSKSQSPQDVMSIGVILSSPLPKTLSANDPDLLYRTTLTSSASLHPPYRGRFFITVTEQGLLRGATWSAVPKAAGFDGRGDFDMKVINEGPRPIFEAPALSKGGKVGSQQAQSQGNGEEEEEPERTFLQKYWWAILGALFLIVMMGGDDK